MPHKLFLRVKSLFSRSASLGSKFHFPPSGSVPFIRMSWSRRIYFSRLSALWDSGEVLRKPNISDCRLTLPPAGYLFNRLSSITGQCAVEWLKVCYCKLSAGNYIHLKDTKRRSIWDSKSVVFSDYLYLLPISGRSSVPFRARRLRAKRLFGSFLS